MQRYVTVATAGFLASISHALPDDADRQTVKKWDDLVTGLGYDYEMFKVTTEDSWELTLFRITHKIGEEQKLNQDYAPLLMQHSWMMDAESWMAAQPEDYKPVPLQLVDQGYDVWMANSRGTKYSLTNPKFPYAEDPRFITQYVMENKRKYDYSWYDQGKYDLPAFLDKVYTTTERDVTYVGYGEGTSQLLYSLTQNAETNIGQYLEKAVLMAPCIYTSTLGLENYQETFPVYREQLNNVVNDPNW